MTIRHIALFSWNDDATPAQIAAVTTGLDALATIIPNLVRYEYGPDLCINDGNAQYAIVAEFASVDDYLVYRDHPDHQAFIVQAVRPISRQRTAVQFEVGS